MSGACTVELYVLHAYLGALGCQEDCHISPNAVATPHNQRNTIVKG